MKITNINQRLRVTAAAVLACCLMVSLVGCTAEGELGGSTTTNTQTGATTVTVTGKVTFKPKPLQKFAFLMAPPLSGSDLASLDVTQAIFNYSLSNATISSTIGTGTITVTDGTTGAIVGQQDFAYDVRGNGLFAHDPNAVSSWLQQFTAYPNVGVTVAAATDMQATSAGTASVTTNAVYQGVTYASSSASWTRSPIGGGGGCHTRICPNQ